MGADLICYIAVGPSTVECDGTKSREIAEKVKKFMGDCVAAAEQILLGNKDVDVPCVGSGSKAYVTVGVREATGEERETFATAEELRANPGYGLLITEILGELGLSVVADHRDDTVEAIVEIVDNFVGLWRNGDARDCAKREDPFDSEVQIMVAGERTWGDTPDGDGFQTLRTAFELGIAQQLGVQ